MRAQLDSTLGLALGLWASAPIASSLYALILLRVSQLSLYYFSRVLFVCVDLLNRHTARLAGSSLLYSLGSDFSRRPAPGPRGPAVRCRWPGPGVAGCEPQRRPERGMADGGGDATAGSTRRRARRQARSSGGLGGEIEHPTRRAPHPIS